MGNESIRYRRSKFSTRLLTDRLYTAGHAWLKNEEGDLWRIGLTKFASRMLGEAVELDLEIALGDPVETGQVIGWIEGFKAVTDIYAPLAGTFQGVNDTLLNNMELLRSDPYGDGWLYAVEGKPDANCMDVDAYSAVLDRTIDKMMGTRQEGDTASANDTRHRIGTDLSLHNGLAHRFGLPVATSMGLS